MKQFILLTLAATTIGLGLSAAGFSLYAAELDEESQQIARLQSSRSLQEKDAACVRLKRVGTSRSVPALAALLTDEQLSHSARYALESMPWPEASQALQDALDKTSGLTQAGLINSLGNRRETAAVPALAKRLANADAVISTAAATALGKIAGTEALNALNAVWEVLLAPPMPPFRMRSSRRPTRRSVMAIAPGPRRYSRRFMKRKSPITFAPPPTAD